MAVGLDQMLSQFRHVTHTKKGKPRKGRDKKINDAQRDEIRKLAPTMKYRYLAKMFGISERTIYKLCGPKRKL